MALAFLNRCVWRATSTGTGSFVVASAITGYKVPNDCAGPAVSDGATYFYFAQSDDKTQWEIGYDAFDVTTSTLPRTNILDSTNAGAAVSFSAAPSVFMGVTLANDWPFSGTALPETSVIIIGGAGATDGGGVTITSGAGTSGDGGPVTLTGGTGNVSGGAVGLVGGSGDTYGGVAGVYGGAGGVNGGDIGCQAGDGGTDGGHIYYVGGGGSGGVGGSLFFTPGTGTTDGGDMAIELPAAGSGRQGLIIISGLPTSDPSVTGALWSNGGVLTVS